METLYGILFFVTWCACLIAFTVLLTQLTHVSRGKNFFHAALLLALLLLSGLWAEAWEGAKNKSGREASEQEESARATQAAQYMLDLEMNSGDLFDPVVSIPTGGHTGAFAVVDINNDTKPDLVDADAEKPEINVRLGNGDGTFEKLTVYPNVSVAKSVEVVDVNSDTPPDMVTADGEGRSVSVRLGNGNGTYQSPTVYPIVGIANAVVSADVNGDGQPDLVSADGDAEAVSVRLGNGNGVFQSASAYPTGGRRATAYAAAVGIADINGDGRPDLVVGNAGTDVISILIGKGDGSFMNADKVTFGIGASPAVTVADLNGDTKQDVVFSFGRPLSLGNSVNVLWGAGEANGFEVSQVSGGYWLANDVAVADIDGDTIPDIITANTDPKVAEDGGYVLVMRGKGDGQFQNANNYPTGPRSTYVAAIDVAVADVDGDRHPDLLVSHGPAYEGLSLLRNRVTGQVSNSW